MSTNLRWSAERFYWSVLEAPQWKRAGPLPPGLRPVLDEDLPISSETLQAVCAPLGDGRVLVCAADGEMLASLDPDAASLVPECLPDFAGSTVDPASLNLLVGAHEPRAMRSARAKHRLISAAALVALSTLATIGLVRRAAMWDRTAHDAQAATGEVINQSLSGGTPDSLATEVSRLHRLTDSAGRIKPAPDAALALGSLLRSWPAAVSSKPQSLVVSEAGATVSVAVEGDATPFLKALKPPQGWTMDEPRLNTADTVTRLTLQLRPPPGASTVGGTP